LAAHRDIADLDHSSAAKMEEFRSLLADDPEFLPFLMSTAPQSDICVLLDELAIEFLETFELKGVNDDLSKAIELEEKVLEAMASQDPDRVRILETLGGALLRRYKISGSPVDLDRAIERDEEAVALTPMDDPDRAGRLSNLGVALQNQYERTKLMVDLDRAIENREQAVASTRVDHPEYVEYVNNLGIALQIRFDRTGSTADLDHCIESIEQVVMSTAVATPKHAMYLNNLATALVKRYEVNGSVPDLSRGITTIEQALELTPLDSPGRPIILNNLAKGLQSRFKRTGSMGDLDRAVKSSEEALESTPADHPNHSMYLNSLASGLQIRFKKTGSMHDLDRAIKSSERAVELTPVDNPNCAMFLNMLGISLGFRFQRTGSMADLDQAIKTQNKALESTPIGHPTRKTYLNNLGTALLKRYEVRGLLADLDQAIEMIEQAVALTPLRGPDRPGRLNNLGVTLQIRFERTGSVNDLDRAIKNSEKALELTPGEHLDRATYLNNLGILLRIRFERTGSLADLDKGIDMNERAVALTPLNGPDRPGRLYNLAISLERRFDMIGSMNDLDHAIKIVEQAVKSIPKDYLNDAKYLGGLATALVMRFERTGSMKDLDRAIESSNQAVKSTPADNPIRAMYLDGLAIGLQSRFKKTGSMDDLDRAIESSDQAVNSTPVDDPSCTLYLNNLGIALQRRFERTGSIDDLQHMIEAGEQAVELTPLDHPNRASYLNNLGISLQMRFRSTRSPDDLDRAIKVTEQSAQTHSASPSTRLKAAQFCAAMLITNGLHKRAKPILAAAVELLPTLSPRNLIHGDAQFNISKFAHLTALAVSLSIEDSDAPYRSLQLLEVGRGILANLQLEVRSDVSDLAVVYPELARQFQELRDSISSPSWVSERPIAIEDLSPGFKPNSNLSTFIWRTILREFDELLEHIRSLNGFENFLKGPSETKLRSLAQGGAIVVFNVSEVRSDAFLITPADIRCVCLPSLTLNSVKHFTKANMGKVKKWKRNPTESDVQSKARETPLDHVNAKRKATLMNNEALSNDMRTSLNWLWDAAVNPVLNELGLTETPDNEAWPRIWWVTSGLLARLPIHAAGEHINGSNRNAMDRVISSYVPTLQSLAYSQEKVRNQFVKDEAPKVLLVAMPITPSQNALPCAEKEVKQVSAVIPDSFIKTIELQPSKSKVLKSLTGCQVVHFACHGESNPNDPSKSRLLLQDWKADPLSVVDITALNMPDAAIAYLSACSAADIQVESLLDEGIHLAGAFQLAGFPSVVGTLWHISDEHSATVAVDVYRALCEKSGRMNPDDVAGALHLAVRKLRAEMQGKSENSLFWSPYIHMGV